MGGQSQTPIIAPVITSPKTPSKGVGASATRFLRRVASAPNAKGFFNLSKGRQTSPHSRTPTKGHGNGLLSPGRTSPVPEVPPVPGHRVSVSEKEVDSLDTDSSRSSSRQYRHQQGNVQKQSNKQQHLSPNSLLSGEDNNHRSTRQTRALSAASVSLHSKGKEKASTGGNLPVSGLTVAAAGGGLLQSPTPGKAPFRRTYSSNSIKVKQVEVGPNSFQKIKLLGRGDVGKVYLVREKKSERLYAMKGAL